MPEERKRYPLAPREVNIVAQQQLQQNRSERQGNPRAERRPLDQPRETGSDDVQKANLQRASARTKEPSTISSSDKHAQYLSRLHKLAPALRSSSSAPSKPPPFQNAPDSPPVQEQESSQNRIDDEWRLFPILEKSRLSPESVSATSVGGSPQTGSHPMMWQHNVPAPVGEAERRTAQDSVEASGVQPMDLTEDEAWGSEQCSSSPSPSFPSPADSPPQTHANDWLGGVNLWQGQKSPEDQLSRQLSSSANETRSVQNVGDSASAFEIIDRVMCDTVDQLLAIDAASAAPPDIVSVSTLSCFRCLSLVTPAVSVFGAGACR